MSDALHNGCEKVSVSDSAGQEAALPQVKTQLSKRKQHKKLVRLLTVMAYVFSVSLGAIVLSLYYLFLWDPQITREGSGGVRRSPPGPLPRPHALSGVKVIGGVNESADTGAGKSVKVKGKW